MSTNPYTHVGTLYAVVLHTSGSGDLGGYVEMILPDHIYINLIDAEFVRDRLNTPTWEAIRDDPRAHLTAAYLGYSGDGGQQLDYYTVMTVQTRSIAAWWPIADPSAR